MRRLLAATLVATACVFVAPISTDVARADADLGVATTTTYTIDAASGVVRVAVDVAVTNLVADRFDGTSVISRYYTGYSLPGALASANAAAVDATGLPLAVSSRATPDLPDYLVYDITFADTLTFGQTARFTLTYDIVGAPPRSGDPARANPAYSGFTAFGWGDSGQAELRIVIPDGFTVDLFGDPIDKQQIDGATLYTADGIADPNSFNVVVSARNDEALDRIPARAGDSLFEVRSWPGDTAWQSFVTTQIETGVPALAELVGRPWPIDDTVAVVEAYTPYLYGYAGWFSADDRLIEVGEDLDQEVVLHELSHAWFNDEWFSNRWLNEGLAQVYSNKAIGVLGGEPFVPDPIDTTDPGFVVLNDWSDPAFDDGDEAREAYGYNASFDVMSRLVAEVGDEAMRDVLDAVADDTIAYRGERAPEASSTTTDWRRFLDLVEELGGSTGARDLFEQYVVSVGGSPLLEDRARARARYAELLAAGGTWAGPVVVRQQLSDWRFGAAEAAIDEAAAVLETRDTMSAKAQELGLGYPDRLESDYEAVDASFDAVSAARDEQIETIELVGAAIEAEARDTAIAATVGLWGTELSGLIDEARTDAEAGEHDAARAAAQQVIDTVDGAADLGTRRISLAVGALLALILLIVLLAIAVRRRRARRRAAVPPLDQPPIAPAPLVDRSVAPPASSVPASPPPAFAPPVGPPVALPPPVSRTGLTR